MQSILGEQRENWCNFLAVVLADGCLCGCRAAQEGFRDAGWGRGGSPAMLTLLQHPVLTFGEALFGLRLFEK